MTHQSFFHLTPQSDHECITPRELAWLEHQGYLDSLSDAERASVFQDACALANALYHTINAYCEAHQETSYGAIVEALTLIQARIDLEMHDDTPAPEECDA